MWTGERQLTWQIGCRSLKAWLGSNTDLSRGTKRQASAWTRFKIQNLQRAVWAVTWEHKDEAGGQAPDHRDDPADVRDEERQNQRDDKPHQSLQDAPPLLAADAHLHLLALETQPQSFDDRPGRSQRLIKSNL